MYESNEKLVNNRNTRPPRGRYHFLMTYLPEAEIERVLNHYQDYIHSALWIVHDKDKKEVEANAGRRRSLNDVKNELQATSECYEVLKLKLQEIQLQLKLVQIQKVNEQDEKYIKLQLQESQTQATILKTNSHITKLQNELDTWQEPEEVDELKEIHKHVLLYCYDAHTETAVRKWFYRFRITETKTNEAGVEEQVPITTLNEMVDSVGAARDYLTHENDPDKYHYDKKDVHEFGDGWQAFNCASRCRDDALLIIQKIQANESLPEMVREYGKEFVYHYRQYREMANEIHRQQVYATRYAELASTTYLQNTDTLVEASDFNRQRKISPEKFNKAIEIISAFEGLFEMIR